MKKGIQFRIESVFPFLFLIPDFSFFIAAFLSHFSVPHSSFLISNYCLYQPLKYQPTVLLIFSFYQPATDR